jgi:hypothetical protein
MKELIIDGRNLGNCVGYRQRRADDKAEFGAWVFYMEAGYKITVEFMQIKSFTSCGPLDIILYH